MQQHRQTASHGVDTGFAVQVHHGILLLHSILGVGIFFVEGLYLGLQYSHLGFRLVRLVCEGEQNELDKYNNSEEHIKALNEKISELYKKALSVADLIHNNREKMAKELERCVCETLEFLDMPKVVFLIDINKMV